MIRRNFIKALLAISIGAMSPAVSAFAADEQDDALKAIRAGEILPYSKIKRMVEAQLKGKVVGQRLRRTGRGWIYELRIRGKDGGVKFAVVDAKSGRVISSR